MSSEINNQPVTIEQIVVPLGVNIATNASPSLTPINGALAQDVSKPGSLFIGNGTNWEAVFGGGSGNSDAYILNITMTSGNGSPSFTGCTLYLQKYVDANSGFKMASFQLTVNNTSVGATTPNNWVSSAAVIPADFMPGVNLYFPTYCIQGTTVISGSTSCIIGSAGFVTLSVTASATANTAFIQASGIYQLP